MSRRPALTDIERVVPQGAGPPASIPDDLFAATVEIYTAGQRLDMGALARRIGVSRATLYRRAGNREQLLDEVIWWRSRQALVNALRDTRPRRGVDRIAGVVGQILCTVQSDQALQAFLATDPEAALRILTGTRSTVQCGMIDALERLIDLEVVRGDFESALDTPSLAFAIVRLCEGFLYADVIADRTPDPDAATTLVTALLRGLDIAQSRTPTPLLAAGPR